MKYIYILLTLLVLFILVFLVTEDRCKAIEKFTQFPQNKFVCKDSNASNYYSGETSEDQIENNSYCSYNTSVVCNRPFADNYDSSLDNLNKNNISSDISVCGLSHYNNYIDVYEYDDTGNKIKAIKDDASGTPLTYLGKEVIVDSSDTRSVPINEKFLKYKSDNSIVYKQSNVIDNSKCKNINNKICRFPMAKAIVNSVQGISKCNEYSSLINSNNELLPDIYLISGAAFTEDEIKERINKKSLYKELFFETDTIGGFGLNLWDENGFVNLGDLTKSKDIVLNSDIVMSTDNNKTGFIVGSYIDENGNIKNRFGYGFSALPRNYTELVSYARNNDFHVALAVSKKADKYACGIGKTKAIACDIALARCRTFVNFDNLELYFKDLLNDLQTEMKRRRNLYPIRSYAGYGSIYDTKIINESDEDEKELQDIINDYVMNKDELTLATSYYRLMSHKELYNKFLNDPLATDNIIIKKVEKTDSNITSLPTLQEVMNYITDKAKKDEENGNVCGILMIDNNRYMNFNNDATEISSKCSPLPTINNFTCGDNVDDSLCTKSVVLGLDSNGSCFASQESKPHFPSDKDFSLDPVQKEGISDEDYDKIMMQWNNEKKSVAENSKMDLANNLLDKCKNMGGSNCILYKFDGEIYSYNSLFN